MKRPADPSVASVFRNYPPALRRQLMALREVILDVAAKTGGVGPLTETLKWGQPSYLTTETGSGTTVRVDRLKDRGAYAVYFHCQSGLVETFRELYPNAFTYEGKRAIVFAASDRVPLRALRHCLALAFTHHLRKKRVRSSSQSACRMPVVTVTSAPTKSAKLSTE